MKIISWNCRGKFREKCQHIQKENADIYIIQECENPEKYAKEFSVTHLDYIWCGENANKGLAIFRKPEIKLEKNEWIQRSLRFFMSVKINGVFDLVAVWACRPYIEEYYDYQEMNIQRFKADTVIMGDFNSNSVWDKLHGQRNHTVVVEQLREKGLISAYHCVTGEKSGEESQGTFYQYSHIDKPSHIDYCFISPDKIKQFKLLPAEDWLKYSDHIPLLLEI